MLNYDIIKLNIDDYYKCNNIWDMSKEKSADKWCDELRIGNRLIFVSVIHNEFIADGALVFEKNDLDYTIPKRRIYLSRLNVKSEYQNYGIGGAMIDYLINSARKLGFSEISVGVNIDNYNAIHLYNKKGFTTLIFEGEDMLGKYVKLLKHI